MIKHGFVKQDTKHWLCVQDGSVRGRVKASRFHDRVGNALRVLAIDGSGEASQVQPQQQHEDAAASGDVWQGQWDYWGGYGQWGGHVGSTGSQGPHAQPQQQQQQQQHQYQQNAWNTMQDAWGVGWQGQWDEWGGYGEGGGWHGSTAGHGSGAHVPGEAALRQPGTHEVDEIVVKLSRDAQEYKHDGKARLRNNFPLKYIENPVHAPGFNRFLHMNKRINHEGTRNDYILRKWFQNNFRFQRLRSTTCSFGKPLRQNDARA